MYSDSFTNRLGCLLFGGVFGTHTRPLDDQGPRRPVMKLYPGSSGAATCCARPCRCTSWHPRRPISGREKWPLCTLPFNHSTNSERANRGTDTCPYGNGLQTTNLWQLQVTGTPFRCWLCSILATMAKCNCCSGGAQLCIRSSSEKAKFICQISEKSASPGSAPLLFYSPHSGHMTCFQMANPFFRMGYSYHTEGKLAEFELANN